MFTQTELIYSIACTVYVTTCLMFAAVRWFHVCPGAKEHKGYYYPDRKLATLLYSIPVILLPYALSPDSHATWLLAKGYYPLTHFFYCAVLLFNYFGTIRQWRQWQTSGIVASVLVFSATMVLLAVALTPQLEITETLEYALNTIVITIGLLMTAYCGVSMYMVWQWIHEYSTDNFSNTDDFPLSYAKGVLIIPILHALLIWPVILFDSQTWMATMQLLLSVFNIVFLISILPSQRKGNPLEKMIEDNRMDDEEEALIGTVTGEEENKNCPPQSAENSSNKLLDDNKAEFVNIINVASSDDNQSKSSPRRKAMSEQAKEKIKAGIKMAVEEQQQYLNPHLSLDDVIEACGYSHGYVSAVLREECGGFFRYVNLLRIKHVEDYMSGHPEVTKEEAIIKSGFDSRQSYYRIRKRLFPEENMDSEKRL